MYHAYSTVAIFFIGYTEEFLLLICRKLLKMLTQYIFLPLLLLMSFHGLSSSSSSKKFQIITNQKNEQKSGHQSVFRRFAFPLGTFLIFEPEIILPAWRDDAQRRSRKVGDYYSDLTCGSWSSRHSREGFEDDGALSAVKNADVIIASPFYVYFDKLGWTHQDSIYDTHHQVAPYLQNYVINPALDIFGVPRPVEKKDVGVGPTKPSRRRSPPPLSDLHRIAVFHKIEKLLEEVGVSNGKTCLLRAICELHEFHFDSGRYGVVGEVLSLVLGSIPRERSSSNSCLIVYAKAERSGKEKDCSKYARYCPHSIFEWYWRISKNSEEFRRLISE